MQFLHADNEDTDQSAQMHRLFESSLGAHVRRFVTCRCVSITDV